MHPVIKESAYKVLDFFTFGRGMKITINGFKLRFPTRYFRRFPSNYELDNYEFLKKHCKLGDTVIDVGAHLGLFSVCAWQCTGKKGKVYAFEPTPTTHRLLRQTIHINQADDYIHPVQAAVAEKKGTVTFYLGEGDINVSNSIILYPERNRQGYEVPMIALDEFVKERGIDKVDFMKIDAEGAELRVLYGARNILERNKPVCILGMHTKSIQKFGDSVEAIWNFIADCGYRVEFEGAQMSKDDFCSRVGLFEVHLLPIGKND